MRKFFVFSMLALLGMTQAAAQDYEYVPFVREGVKWVYKITNLEYYMGQLCIASLSSKVIPSLMGKPTRRCISIVALQSMK